MPIYEYNCQDCKQIFEGWQKDYEERDLPCPVCGGQATRLISSSSFVLKGGGWFVNHESPRDEAKKSDSPADAPASADAGSGTPGGEKTTAAPDSGSGSN